MKARLYHPTSPALHGLVESFLFQDSDGTVGHYTTFPNTNLCLAIYLGNEARWERTTNQCRVRGSGKPWSSRLYGFHERPFQVDWCGRVQQVNILFRPGALARFTSVPIRLIDMVDDPLTEIFGNADELVGRLFSTSDAIAQVRGLESFLLAHLQPDTTRIATVRGSMHLMSSMTAESGSALHALVAYTRSSPSTIYRSMMDVVGQSPKTFHRTVRFRRALRALLAGPSDGTSIALEHGFYDQAHFIKDVRQFSGSAPGLLKRSAQVVQGEFVWLPR